MHELDEKKGELRAVQESLIAAEKLSRGSKTQAELLVEEKKNLQTQLAGLKHRIDQFEVVCQFASLLFFSNDIALKTPPLFTTWVLRLIEMYACAWAAFKYLILSHSCMWIR